MRHVSAITVLFGYILLVFPAVILGGPTANTVKRAQEALKTYGINPGPIDGIMGSRTREAIKIFQAENMLNETGRLDRATQEKLGIVFKHSTSTIETPHPSEPPPTPEPIAANENFSPSPPEISPQRVLLEDENSTEIMESTSEKMSEESTPKAVNEKEKSLKPHISHIAMIRIAVLAGLSLAALRPVGWGILTGISLILSALMFHWIGSLFNSPFFLVFAFVYSTPILFHLIAKSWDIALVFAVCLGVPVILVSKYAIGTDWVVAACSGLAVMTLLPSAYRRFFSKPKFRQPYGMLYYRF